MGSDSGSFDHAHHVRHHHQAPLQETPCTQTNLVSDGSGPAAHIADDLINPWGISHAPTGPFWMSDNGSGVTTVYNGAGNLIPIGRQDAITVAAPPGQAA